MWSCFYHIGKLSLNIVSLDQSSPYGSGLVHWDHFVSNVYDAASRGAENGHAARFDDDQTHFNLVSSSPAPPELVWDQVRSEKFSVQSMEYQTGFTYVFWCIFTTDNCADHSGAPIQWEQWTLGFLSKPCLSACGGLSNGWGCPLEWLADEDDFSHLPWPKGLKTSAVDFFLLELKLNRLKLAEVSLTERAKTATRVILSWQYWEGTLIGTRAGPLVLHSFQHWVRVASDKSKYTVHTFSLPIWCCIPYWPYAFPQADFFSRNNYFPSTRTLSAAGVELL